MKLVCINNKNIEYPSFVKGKNKLIIGKEYNVEEESTPSEFYRVSGFEFGTYGFFKYRFITKQEYRKLKLKNLNGHNM